MASDLYRSKVNNLHLTWLFCVTRAHSESTNTLKTRQYSFDCEELCQPSSIE